VSPLLEAYGYSGNVLNNPPDAVSAGLPRAEWAMTCPTGRCRAWTTSHRESKITMTSTNPNAGKTVSFYDTAANAISLKEVLPHEATEDYPALAYQSRLTRSSHCALTHQYSQVEARVMTQLGVFMSCLGSS
jgi:hypothetical protein